MFLFLKKQHGVPFISKCISTILETQNKSLKIGYQ